MTDQAKPISRPWRRLYRLFSVRGMIVLVPGDRRLVAESGASAASHSAQAVAAIERAGDRLPTTGNTFTVQNGLRSSLIPDLTASPSGLNGSSTLSIRTIRRCCQGPFYAVPSWEGLEPSHG